MNRVQINLEFILRASPTIIYTFLTTPACLVRWFCDEVDIQDDIYTFTWDGADEEAELIDDIENERVRFVWEDAQNEFIEFKMYKAGVTNETVLEITEYVDEGDEESQKDYWQNLINILKKETGG